MPNYKNKFNRNTTVFAGVINIYRHLWPARVL